MLTSASTKAKPRCGIEKDWNLLHVPGCRPPAMLVTPDAHRVEGR